jgi:transcriptional regulator with XRE-family HTH domain
MNVNEWLQLPRRLSAAREAVGMSQRALAKQLGVHASQLCGLERGRRRVGRTEFLEEFSQSVGLSEARLDDLRWALAHDQVLEQAGASGLPDDTIRLLSSAMRAARELDGTVLAGFQHELDGAIRSKRHLGAWAARATSGQEDDAMT